MALVLNHGRKHVADVSEPASRQSMGGNMWRSGHLRKHAGHVFEFCQHMGGGHGALPIHSLWSDVCFLVVPFPGGLLVVSWS